MNELMRGKVCLVTGATGGLGQAIARGLAHLGATVTLACRNEARGASVGNAIISATGNQAVDLLRVDLSSQQSIREAVAAFIARQTRLDILIHSAAVYIARQELTVDGLEMMFATNHLGPFLMTNLLLDLLKASAPARVLTVTAPATTQPDFDDLQSEKRFNSFQAFGATKFCNLLFTFELARRFEGTGLTANAIHPGLVKSNLMGQAPFIMRWLTQLFSGSPEKGAETPLYLASSPEVASTTGKFFKDKKIIGAPASASDFGLQQRLWTVSEQLTGLA